MAWFLKILHVLKTVNYMKQTQKINVITIYHRYFELKSKSLKSLSISLMLRVIVVEESIEVKCGNKL